MMPKRVKLFFAVFLLLVIQGATARSESLVERYFQNLQSLKADFVQQVYDDQSRPLETTHGQLVMQKPGRFRWDYSPPAEQVIVADGQRLWMYDVELEQVTVRALNEALNSTPFALLSGAAPIQDAFTVTRETTSDGWQWFELQPKEEQPDFKRLRVAFQGEELKAIELEDVLNQRTRLTFKDLQRNVSLDPGVFTFTPPPGVDVIGDVPG
ncbi:MAG: outer membrane lipoprotein chaperone LolA [Gammaproteobacteria bacterium]|nr:outer membrane lipoprotein chaperone LolA [Gammaproteobacteria bacterium]MCP5459599.1 outer membrane lipoprotein chaperone LolA [Gammaproteobacteria bacterium]